MAKTRARKVSYMPITEARVNLGAVVRRVRVNKEYIILEKGGIPVAGIMDADELEDYLEIHDPKVQAQIEKSTRAYLAGKSRPARKFLAELEKEKGAGSERRRRA
ncbi:MAG: type II toxin-antitoxin system Phd/YefM family antitoxin [Acidobacteria bacterium]|nr:type II toxin-antitoxin system Phd/YefM family antitoxin [Acidobacteriota bacterium]